MITYIQKMMRTLLFKFINLKHEFFFFLNMQEKCLGFEDLNVVPDYRSFYEPHIDPKLKYYCKPHNFRFKRTEDSRWLVEI